jgi:hypothetical protein
MRKFLLCAATLFSCVLQANECQESLIFSYDDKKWNLGFEDSDEDSSLIEFVPQGETVNDWTEMVSVQRLQKIDNVQDYYKIFMEQLRLAVNPQKVDSKILSSSKDSLLFEWWIGPDNQEAQHEWFRLIVTPNSTLILRYTTKKLDEVEKVGPIWSKILQDATIQQEGDCPKPSS